MGIFNFSKKGKSKQHLISPKIACHEIPNDDFVLYEHSWAGKGECGSQWVQFTVNCLECEVTYHDVYFNQYANPWAETHNTKKTTIDFPTILASTYSEIISIINKTLELSLDIKHCSPEENYNYFVNRMKTIETGELTETIY